MKELIVDSFAGGGGASLGIEMAIGRVGRDEWKKESEVEEG